MIVGYLKGDAQKVSVQAAQVEEAVEFAAFFDEIEGYSVIDEKGAVKAIFGFRLEDDFEAQCFGLVGENIGRQLTEVVRFLLKIIPIKMAEYRCQRLFMTVKKNFKAGRKMAVMLGFRPAEVLENFFCGEDYQLFERNEK